MNAMKIKFTLASLFILFACMASAQSIDRQLIGANGTVLKSGDYQLSYSIGEISVQAYYKRFPTLTEGFQQPHVARTGEILNGYVRVSAYPNPTTGLVTLDIYGYKFETFNVRICDAIGKTVATPPFTTRNGSITIDLTAMPAGAYFIAVTDNHYSTAVSAAIIKQHL
jgi:hypothetical protein